MTQVGVEVLDFIVHNCCVAAVETWRESGEDNGSTRKVLTDLFHQDLVFLDACVQVILDNVVGAKVEANEVVLLLATKSFDFLADVFDLTAGVNEDARVD